MVITIQEVQIGLMLQNQGYKGVMIPPHTYESIGFATIAEAYVYSNGYGYTDPTDQQMIDWQTSWDTQQQLEQDIRDDLASYGLTLEQTEIAVKLNSSIIKQYAVGNNPDISTVFNAFGSVLTGSVLDQTIKDFVAMRTGILSFAGLTESQKRTVIDAALDYIHGVLIVRLGANL